MINNLIKLDTQGTELNILDGIEDIKKKSCINRIGMRIR